ncbi:hypothetical protein AB833_18850 [Chromatiales bacterium (ex Bugula neritina AB1)]|nr:hypothetical protein AB833_18850 [Chromatiales bacterium (ex Bugula neritina AB1)]
MRKGKTSYHHGNLAESLLDAVDEIATRFGLEAVTLRACAKLIGVSPSSAFRHYADKRSLLTAFATRALDQLSVAMLQARNAPDEPQPGDNAFTRVGLAYVKFALDKPAFFRAMWSEETLYTNDENYTRAANQLSAHLKDGFGETLKDNDPDNLSAKELLAWSALHGLANLFVDGPIGKNASRDEKLMMAREMILAAAPALSAHES